MATLYGSGQVGWPPASTLNRGVWERGTNGTIIMPPILRTIYFHIRHISRCIWYSHTISEAIEVRLSVRASRISTFTTQCPLGIRADGSWDSWDVYGRAFPVSHGPWRPIFNRFSRPGTPPPLPFDVEPSVQVRHILNADPVIPIVSVAV